MEYAKFYRESELVPGMMVQAIGSDSICLMDSRLSLRSMRQVAVRQAQRLIRVQPGYKAFRIFRTDSLLNEGAPLTDLIMLDQVKED